MEHHTLQEIVHALQGAEASALQVARETDRARRQVDRAETASQQAQQLIQWAQNKAQQAAQTYGLERPRLFQELQALAVEILRTQTLIPQARLTLELTETGLVQAQTDFERVRDQLREVIERLGGLEPQIPEPPTS